MKRDRTTKSLERNVLGAPFVPPGRIVRWVTTARRRLLGIHERTASPQLRIMETLFAQLDAHVLRVLVELGIPDLLDRPRSVSELAAGLELDDDSFDRLIRYAATRDFVVVDKKGTVRATGVTTFLKSDSVAPWHAWVRFATSRWFDEAFRHLGVGIATRDRSPFDAAHGMDFFAYAREVNPEAGAVFDQAMSAGVAIQAISLARTLDWTGVTSLCDLGGGSGTALQILQQYHPDLEATLFDLPEVVARSGFLEQGLPNRQVIGGSFFEEVPAGHDRYLLLAIVHDWNDERAAELLSNVRRAMGPSSTAVVVETPRSEAPIYDFAAVSDLLMLTLALGRERTEDELGRLFHTAGLAIAKRHLLTSGATAYELTVA